MQRFTKSIIPWTLRDHRRLSILFITLKDGEKLKKIIHPVTKALDLLHFSWDIINVNDKRLIKKMRFASGIILCAENDLSVPSDAYVPWMAMAFDRYIDGIMRYVDSL